jgi:hypothetical protein
LPGKPVRSKGRQLDRRVGIIMIVVASTSVRQAVASAFLAVPYLAVGAVRAESGRSRTLRTSGNKVSNGHGADLPLKRECSALEGRSGKPNRGMAWSRAHV